MSRIKDAFKNKKPFIGYITAGACGHKKTVSAALAMIDGGVDILELGIPFSDPVGDGPVIQCAHQRALKNKTTPSIVLEVVKEIRKKSKAPIVLMTYYNPILQAGKSFFLKAKKVGVDGILIIDLPIEEAQDYLKNMKASKLDPIFLVTPSTKSERLKKIASSSQGFIYYASQKGTTGVKKSLPRDLAKNVKQIKKISSKPVAVGFGIGSKKDAASVLKVADAFVVGSLFVSLLDQKATQEQIKNKARSLKP